MACRRCEISTYTKNDGIDLFLETETWLSAHGDEAKTVELATSGFDIKSSPRQSRRRGGFIIEILLRLTFEANFYFAHTSFEKSWHQWLHSTTLRSFLFESPSTQPTKRITDSMFNQQLHDIHYMKILPGHVFF